MNIYTVEEREAQYALELVKALEAEQGNVGVQIAEDKSRAFDDLLRHILITITPEHGRPWAINHAYDPADGFMPPLISSSDYRDDLSAAKARARAAVDRTKAQASERLGATLDTLRAAVADGDLTRADVEAETEAVQTAEQPKAKAPAAPAKRHAGRKTTPKGKRS